jgi:hypothetical protein
VSSTAIRPGVQAPVESLAVSAFTVPTDEPESDGTLEWDSTTIVVVEARAGDETGLGYTYAPAAAGRPLLFDGVLEPVGAELRPDRSRPGHGLELRRADAQSYAV